jgi:uncharacterized protein (DUF4415 family)
MKKRRDSSKKAKGYSRARKVQKTIRLDEDIVETCQKTAERSGIPYQTLINLILRQYLAEKKSVEIRF